jgi:hypothetical protein
MIGIVLIAISASVLLAVGLGMVMFVDAAFGGARAMHGRSLPLLTGESLKAWAVSRGRATTAAWLAVQPARNRPDELARGIETEAGQLLEEVLFRESPAAQGVQRCREGESPPRVTAPEAFAIVRELRKLPLRDQEQLKQRVSSTRVDQGVCPLLTAQGMCWCAAARPLGCRGRCLAGFDSSNDAARWAETLEAGLAVGVQQTLDKARLDGARYDLNAALAAVLCDPSSESRWRSGQALIDANG